MKLLEAGADPNVTDEFGFTPLMRAVVSTSKPGITNDSEVVSSIITALCNSKCSVNAAFVPSKPFHLNVHYYEGSTALHMAIDEWRVDQLCIQALVDNGAALDARDVHGRTPLHLACLVGYQYLIDSLDPNQISFLRIKDNNGCIPLYYACKNSHLECIQAFIDQCSDIISTCDLMKVANNDGTTPLSVRTGSGGTILHAICDKGEINLVKKLLEAGADPNVTDEFGLTPLMRAVVSTSKSGITTDVVCSIITALCNSKCSVNAAFVPSKPSDSNYCEGSTALHMAIDGWTYNRLCVQGLVYNAALDARDVHGRTSSHLACDEGDINLVKKLLEAGADPNVTDVFGFTPLMRAVLNTCVSDIDMSSIVTILCNGSYNVNATFQPCKSPDKYMQWKGTTALYMAVDRLECCILCVKALIGNGATVDVTDTQGRTPLHITSIRGHQSFIKLFNPTLESCHLRDFDGCTPLYYACKNSHLECVREFMVQIPDFFCNLMNVANKYGATPLSVRGDNDQTILHVACAKGDFSIVTKLLEAGADPNVRDGFGCTPLYYACKNSHLDCVREFMVQIPDVICDLMKVANNDDATPLSVRTGSGGTILHISSEKGDLSIVKKVLEAGADPNCQDGRTFTPLMLAVKHVDDVKAADIVTILCEFKCNINIQTAEFSRSLTALHLACELGKEKCVKILVAKGANLLVRAKGGLTPLHLACKGGYHTFISSLITEETVKAYDNFKYWTPLHYACRYHHIECVRMIVVGFSKLLQAYTEYYVNLPFHILRNQNGRTILHHAFLRNDAQFVENLLNLDADPNVQDNDGATPLMSALLYYGSRVDMNLLSLVLSLDWKPDIKDDSGRTTLHFSAKCDDIRIPLMLISAGCDVTAVDNHGQTFSDLISKESLQLINKQLLKIDRRQIICVVGYPKCGKTTIIAAFQQAQQNQGTFQRFTARLKFNARVTLDDSRTAGIDTKVITTKRLGSIIFFDFAGQSEYYVSHLAFLENALSAKGSTITFIMMVDLRYSKEDRIAQCKEWLFPIKSILKDHNMLNVILIGSHLDQVESVFTSTSSLWENLRELKRTFSTPQMQFVDSWGMDCRQLSSKGMTNLQICLQSTSPVHNPSAEESHVPLGACLLFDKLKKSENPPLAITPSRIIDKLKDGRPPFPLTVKYIDSFCQELAASGIVLYIPNREDVEESWLILEMEEILSRIHGKLFAPDSSEFPMHHKNLANQFGLVHMEELTLAFKDSPLDPEMVQKVLMAMEFCHPVDSSLMTEEILEMLFSKVSANADSNKRLPPPKVSTTEKGSFSNFYGNLLFFPSLVNTNEESFILSTEFDIPGDDCHWVCWELSTVKPHFLHPRFQQAVFIRLACKYVQKHKSDLSTVEEHSCTVSKNAMSWSTIHGMDICIQIVHKSTIKVLARSRPGVKVSSLMEMFSSVVSDVLTVRANHAPGVDAYSVLHVMEKGTPGEHTVPVSSIIDVVQAGGMYVNSRECPPKLISLKDLFLNWKISVILLEKMVSISEMNHYVQTVTTKEDVCEDTHNGSVMIDVQYNESQKLLLSDVYSALTTDSEDIVASKWKLFAQYLEFETEFIQVIEQACLDSCSCSFSGQGMLNECLYNVLEAWLYEEEGSDELPRTWDTIVTVLESCGIFTLAENLRKQIRHGDSNTPQDIGNKKQKSPSGDKEQRTTVCTPSPAPDKHGSKHDVTSLLIIKDDLIRLIGLKTCVKWSEFSLYLDIEKHIRDEVSHNCHRVAKDCFIEVVGRWLSHEDGTGDKPRTWETVFSALFDMGHSYLVEEVKAELFTTMATKDNLLVLLKDAHESWSSTKPLVETQEKSPKSDVPQNVNSGSLSQPQSIGQDVLGSLTSDKEQSSPVQTGADEDTLPILLDDIHESKGCTKKSVIRAQDRALESDVPQEEEESGSESQLNQKLLKMRPTEAELVRLVGSQMCAKWNTFAVYLGIEKHIRDEVSYKCLREPKDCFIEVVGRWLSHEDGTGDSPRTWETVFSALREMGFTLLVKEVTQKLSKRLETSQQ